MLSGEKLPVECPSKCGEISSKDDARDGIQNTLNADHDGDTISNIRGNEPLSLKSVS